jgi:predicted transporter
MRYEGTFEPAITSVLTVTTTFSKNMFQELSCFPLLQHIVPTMTLSHAGCLVPRKNTTDRQTRRTRTTPENVKIKIYKTILFFLLFYMGIKHGLSH